MTYSEPSGSSLKVGNETLIKEDLTMLNRDMIDGIIFGLGMFLIAWLTCFI
jgi:hypothetical protein